nr:hypothetical protein [Actinomadura coerulea]
MATPLRTAAIISGPGRVPSSAASRKNPAAAHSRPVRSTHGRSPRRRTATKGWTAAATMARREKHSVATAGLKPRRGTAVMMWLASSVVGAVSSAKYRNARSPSTARTPATTSRGRAGAPFPRDRGTSRNRTPATTQRAAAAAVRSANPEPVPSRRSPIGGPATVARCWAAT